MSTDKYQEAIEIARKLAVARPAWKVEICGSWVWIDGTSKDDTEGRELLKSLKCTWSKDKQKWYHKGADCVRGKAMPMDYIREKYGYQSVRMEQELAA